MINRNTLAQKHIAEKMSVTCECVRMWIKRDEFPPPSFVTPGIRGKRVWLSETFDTWLAEYLNAEPITRDERTDAARQATVIAIQRDRELKQHIKRERISQLRESKNDQVEMATG